MSLFGQPWDRITHVIVPKEWERAQKFLFPPRDEVSRVPLIDTSFIRLRSHVTSALAKADIGSLLQSAQTAIDLAVQHPLALHVKHRTVEYLDKAFG